MQHVLQTALSAGLSATSGFHSSRPPPMPKDHDDTQDLTPSGFVPQGFPEGKVTYRGKNSNVDASWITIGAWPWGDTATWHWDDATERGPLKQAWQILLKKGVNHIDTAQVYGSGESKRICGELVAGMNQNDFVMRTKCYPMKYIEPTLEVQKRIAEKLGVPVAAVALNYNLVHGIVPVVGVRKPEQAEQDTAALRWALSREEIAELDRVSFEGKTTALWQQG
ncbi:hypothetical protein LTR35_017399 [Friedmanniomyces endolithicus]|nr:hypothetical protein LTR35_017399 [Friedmanniomyces endolithicus]